MCPFTIVFWQKLDFVPLCIIMVPLDTAYGYTRALKIISRVYSVALMVLILQCIVKKMKTKWRHEKLSTNSVKVKRIIQCEHFF